MVIRNHRLEGPEIHYVASPNVGPLFAAGLPDTIIVHFTNMANAAAAITRLCNPAARVSAHLVVARDGAMTQLVPFDTVAWHAGKSAYQGRSGWNQYAIGIEIDNAGRLTRQQDRFISEFGQPYPAREVTRATHANEHNPAYWHTFTPVQIELVTRLCTVLMASYSIRWLLGHDEIAPDRKCDPGPAFPLQALRRELGLHLQRDNA